MTVFPRTRSGNVTIWVIVERLTKSSVVIPIKDTWKKKQLAKTYIRHVVRLHGVPRDIIVDRDLRFLSKFQKKVQLNLGRTLNMSIAFHPAIDSQIKRTNQTMEDMLSACAINFQGSLGGPIRHDRIFL